MKNCYEVVNNANTITNGVYTVRWTGSKLSPQFVARDVAAGIGYSNTQAMYKKFYPEYVDSERGKKGRVLMRSVTIHQIEQILSTKYKRLDESRAVFAEFWEDYVLPEFDPRYAKIAEQKREIEMLRAKLDAVKSLVA